MMPEDDDLAVWEQALGEVLGVPAPEVPLCLSEIWEEGAPLQDADKRRCILLLALLFRDRQIMVDAAKKALAAWSGNEILAESEVGRAYASEEKLTCKLMHETGCISKRCERDYCDFPAWRKSHNIASLEKIKKQKIDQKFKKAEEQPEASSEVPDEIRKKALEILQLKDPIKYIVDSCGRMVLGAEKAFEKLICCMAVQGVKQSAGLHPKLNGESGSGKTWAVLTFAHHLPSEAVVKGSTSNLAAFYHDDGDQVFRILDDYQAGNETLDTIIKQTSSVFHQPYSHRTVKRQEPVTLNMGSEQTWAITSVDSSQDIQVLNRQIPINVNDSEDLTRQVNTRTIERYGEGEEVFPEDETVLVCRDIWRILREEGSINVRIPYYRRIEWLDTSNRRNPSIFMDLLVAHTAMKRHQRPKDEKGYYLASEEDFHAAKALFTDRDGEELVKRLTSRERDVIGLLLGCSDGLTRDEIAERLHIAPQRVSQILNGQKGAGGLSQKVQIRETRISEMVRIDEDTRRTIHKIVYSLSDYDRFTGFDAVVRLLPDPDDPGKPRKHDESIDESKQSESSNDDEIKESKKKKERDLPLSSPPGGSFSHKNEKNTFVAFVEASDNEKDTFVNPSLELSRKPDSLSSGDDQETPLSCAVCGADLTKCSRVERDGKLYCARPGCGYPLRGKAEAET